MTRGARDGAVRRQPLVTKQFLAMTDLFGSERISRRYGHVRIEAGGNAKVLWPGCPREDERQEHPAHHGKFTA